MEALFRPFARKAQVSPPCFQRPGMAGGITSEGEPRYDVKTSSRELTAEIASTRHPLGKRLPCPDDRHAGHVGDSEVTPIPQEQGRFRFPLLAYGVAQPVRESVIEVADKPDGSGLAPIDKVPRHTTGRQDIIPGDALQSLSFPAKALPGLTELLNRGYRLRDLKGEFQDCLGSNALQKAECKEMFR